MALPEVPPTVLQQDMGSQWIYAKMSPLWIAEVGTARRGCMSAAIGAFGRAYRLDRVDLEPETGRYR